MPLLFWQAFKPLSLTCACAHAPRADDGNGRSHGFGRGNRRHSGYSEPSEDDSAETQMDDEDESSSAPPPPRPRHRQHQPSHNQGSGMRRKPRKAALDARARWGTRAHDALEMAMRGMMPDSSGEEDSEIDARHQVVLEEKPRLVRQQQPRMRAGAWGTTAGGAKQRGKVVVSAPPPASTSSSSSPLHWKAQVDEGAADPWEFGQEGVLTDDEEANSGSLTSAAESKQLTMETGAAAPPNMNSGPHDWLKAALEMPSSRSQPCPAPPSTSMESLMQSAFRASSPPRAHVPASPAAPPSPAQDAANSSGLQQMPTLEHQGVGFADEESEAWREEGEIAGVLEDAAKAASDSGGALLLGKGVVKVMPGEGGGGHWSSGVGVRTDGISTAIDHALADARAATMLVRAEGREAAGARLEQLKERAEALRGLLEGGASARSELLATGKPTKVCQRSDPFLSSVSLSLSQLCFPCFPCHSNPIPGHGARLNGAFGLLQICGSASEWDASRLEALAAKRNMVLNNTWGGVSHTAGASSASSPSSLQKGIDTVYIGRLGGRPEKEVRSVLENKCGRVDDFEWCRSWCFAKFGSSAGAAKAVAAGDSFEGMVALPAPGGRVVRGGVLVEMGTRGKVNV